MSKRSQSPSVGRRNFLKGATLVGAAALTTPVAANTAISGRACDIRRG
jgi:acetolactate synthase-1/2/3 large subunit